MPVPMARRKKRVELRPVEDASRPEVAARLENEETRLMPKAAGPVVKLPPLIPRGFSTRAAASAARDAQTAGKGAEAPPVSGRLEVPAHDTAAARTHQPGIEVLIDSATDAEADGEWTDAPARRTAVPWGWFALIALVIIGALAWSLSRVEKADERVEQIRSETESMLAKDASEEREAQDLVERIQTAISRFFGAATVDELVPLVRHPERVLPLVRRHHADVPLGPSGVRSIRMLQPVTIDNRADFWVASVLLEDGATRNLVIEIDADRNPRIDWETCVFDQPMPWDRYAMERPPGTSMDFRVHAEQDEFFTHEFTDKTKWVCFRLTTPESGETLFGYAGAGGPVARELMEIIGNYGGRASVILRLVIPEGLQSRRGVVIEKVMASRWMYLDSPDAPP